MNPRGTRLATGYLMPCLTTVSLLAAACSGGSGHGAATSSSPAAAPTTASTGATMAPAGPGAHPLLAVHGVGVNVLPVELLDGMPQQPTGQALVSQMQSDGVQLARLAWGNQYASQLANGGWRTVFSRLASAHINVLLTLHMQPPGVSEAPGAANGVVTDLGALIASEESVLSAIKSQFGGAYPSNLVALDVYNEPVLNTQTVGSLQQLASAVKSFSGGIPVTVGGWRNAGAATAEQYNDPNLSGLAASIGDFVSAHLYPANMPGGSLSSTSVSDITTFVQSFMTTALSSIASQGHSGIPILISETGGENGQAPSGGFQTGGSPQHQAATVQAVLQTAKLYVAQGMKGVLIWWMTPPPSEICNGSSLVCFNGFTSPAIPLIAQFPFN